VAIEYQAYHGVLMVYGVVMLFDFGTNDVGAECEVWCVRGSSRAPSATATAGASVPKTSSARARPATMRRGGGAVRSIVTRKVSARRVKSELCW